MPLSKYNYQKLKTLKKYINLNSLWRYLWKQYGIHKTDIKNF